MSNSCKTPLLISIETITPEEIYVNTDPRKKYIYKLLYPGSRLYATPSGLSPATTPRVKKTYPIDIPEKISFY